MSRYLNLVLKESPLDSPFAPNEKRWVAAAIAAAAALGSAVIGSASNNATNNTNEDLNKQNLDMQRETNKLNADLQRETNAQNYKMMQEQNAFNLDMWNKENSYNTPAQQVQRLLAAGINPASGFGNVSNASSLTSAVGSPSVAPQMQAPKNMFSMRPTDWSGMSDAGQGAVNAYNQSRLMAAETKNKEALTANTAMDTTFKSKSMQDTLKHLHNIANGSGWQAQYAKKQIDFINATMDYDIQMKYGDMMMQQQSFQKLANEMRFQELQNDILEVTKGYASQMNQAQIASLWSSVHQANAQIGLINANKLLTDEQRLHEIEKKTSTIIDNGMKGVDFEVKKAVKSSLIQYEKDKSDILNFENRNKVSGERFRRFQSIIPFTAGYEKPKFF